MVLRDLSDRFYIIFKSVALWKLSDPIWKLYRIIRFKWKQQARGLSNMNFITAWNQTGIMETWYESH